MSTVFSSPARSEFRVEPVLPWAIALAGWAAMYLPVYWTAANGIWQTEEQGHGALILAVVLWLFWTHARQIQAIPPKRASGWGWSTLGFGLLIYILGRAFNITIFEFGSQIFVAAALLLLLRGRAALQVAWFPVLYLIFMIPLPSVLVDAITGSLKQWISVIVEAVLYACGYPIARTGVILSIGQYQLQVADACSGLHSMFSLSALGTLFMYIMGRKSKLHNAIMLASILPIAFAANVVRVIVLVLITFYFGDEAGQGFLHGTAGMVLMLVSLMFFFAIDSALAVIIKQPLSNGRQSPADIPHKPH